MSESMYNESVSQTLIARIERHERIRMVLQDQIIEAQHDIETAEIAMTHWRFVLNAYREEHGIYTDNEQSRTTHP